MSAPAWFDKNVYFQNKLAQLKAAEPAANWTESSLVKAFHDSGYDASSADSLFSHFEEWGNAEGVSPSGYFVPSDYLQNKLTQMQASDPTYTMDQLQTALKDAGLSAWDHYTQFGAAEGLSTSQYFNTNEYLNAKLAQMQATDASYTMDQLKADLQAAGLNPIEHYELYGKDESLSYTPSTYPAAPEPPVLPDPGNPGETFYLTEGRDRLTGTTADDTFIAEIDDLQAQDRIDGGEGNDTLHAYLGVSNAAYAINPTITNVETLLFTAQGEYANGGGNNLTQAAIDFDRVSLADGKVMTVGSFNSRADLKIEDVRHNSNETVIRFQDADPMVDFNVYFDGKHIVANDAVTTGNLYLQLIDAVGAAEARDAGTDMENGALRDNPYTGFNFTLNGTEYRINFGTYNSTTDDTPTYAELVAKIQETINADSTLSSLGLTVKLGSQFDATVGIGDHQGETVQGTVIEITTEQGALGQGNWIAANGLPPTNSTSATMSSPASTDCPLTTTTLELSGAGRVDFVDNLMCLPNLIKGSSAGDVVIGSMANANGVERIELRVDEGSWISSLSSTNEALRMIKVTGQDIDGDGVAENGELYIGDWNGRGNLKGDGTTATWTDKATLLTAARATVDTDGDGVLDANPAGLIDVAVFDAEGYTGNINVAAEITDASYDKYLKGVDGNEAGLGNPPLPGYDNAFTYRTGTGNDVVNMTVNGDIAADSDFKMNIDTGAGDDLVAFRFADMSVNQAANQKGLQNVTISTGAGNDTVWFYGDNGGSTVINTGAGNDVVYANQQEFFTGGAPATPTSYNAVWVFNNGADNRVAVTGLDGATVRNDLLTDGATFTTAPAAAGNDVLVQVDFLGFTATMKIEGSANTANTLYTMSAKQVNQAIMKAIDSDATLSALISAKDGASHSLIIESLINGQRVEGDLNISFGTLDADGNFVADRTLTSNTGVNNAYASEFATSDGTTANQFKGVNSTDSQVVVNAGAGDDVIVLGPNGALRDIVELDGAFGNDAIVGFDAANDKINVNAFINNAASFTAGDNRAASLVDNLATVAALSGPTDTASGIYSQEDITAFLAAGSLGFAAGEATTAKGVVLLQATNGDGQLVYTVVQMTNGATATATIMGSFTLDDNASAITSANLVVSNAFDASVSPTPPTPGTPGKGETAAPAFDATNTIDMGPGSYHVDITSALTSGTYTLHDFGVDDVLYFGSGINAGTLSWTIDKASNSATATVTDIDNDIIEIKLENATLLTSGALNIISANGTDGVNTVFENPEVVGTDTVQFENTGA